MASKEPTIGDVDGLTDIPWVRYVKLTGEKAVAPYKVVTEVGVLVVDGEIHTIENSGFEVKAIASASDYGLTLYIDEKE